MSDHFVTLGLSSGSGCLTISLHWGCLLVLGVWPFHYTGAVSWFWVSDHFITPGLSPGSGCLAISLHRTSTVRVRIRNFPSGLERLHCAARPVFPRYPRHLCANKTSLPRAQSAMKPPQFMGVIYSRISGVKTGPFIASCAVRDFVRFLHKFRVAL